MANADGVLEYLNCNICKDLLHEPYMLQCGHSFCYDCLRDWLPDRSTCPSCRIKIRVEPVLNLQLREIVQAAVHAGLDPRPKPELETSAAQAATRASEDQSTYHPQTGGLFKGKYAINATRDLGEDFDRCGRCHGRVQDKRCGHCGLGVRSWVAARLYWKENQHHVEEIDDSDEERGDVGWEMEQETDAEIDEMEGEVEDAEDVDDMDMLSEGGEQEPDDGNGTVEEVIEIDDSDGE